MKMPDETMPTLVIATENDNDEFQLTSQERRLLSNFRSMKRSAQSVFIEMSENFKRTIPAEPVKLRLL
jgi:hypothetical protein